MRKLTLTDTSMILLIALGTFLLGIYLGRHNSEQNLYLMFCKLGVEARNGNLSAKTACRSLFEVREKIDDTNTSKHIYWVLNIYGKD
jgi:hypothetical protein